MQPSRARRSSLQSSAHDRSRFVLTIAGGSLLLRDQSLYDAGIGASWEIDLFGGLRRGAEAASAEARAAEDERLSTRVSVAADAADAYLRIRGDQARIAFVNNQSQLNRSDVIAAERLLAASNARVGEAIAEYYPRISLSGLLGFESRSASTLFKSATFQPQAVVGVRWRLFDFGKIDAEVARARGVHGEALARYRQSVLRAAEDVEDAFVTLVEMQAHTQELRNEVAALERARDSSQEAYIGGVIPLTDVLDADRQLLVAEDELALTRADVARAAVNSFRALGGGWSA